MNCEELCWMLPSKELTYPIKSHFWKWFSLGPGWWDMDSFPRGLSVHRFWTLREAPPTRWLSFQTLPILHSIYSPTRSRGSETIVLMVRSNSGINSPVEVGRVSHYWFYIYIYQVVSLRLLHQRYNTPGIPPISSHGAGDKMSWCKKKIFIYIHTQTLNVWYIYLLP